MPSNEQIVEEKIDHPSHYNSSDSACAKCGSRIECISVVESMGFSLGNAVKYIWRADHKGNAIDDLRKARWYIDQELRRRDKDTTEANAVDVAPNVHDHNDCNTCNRIVAEAFKSGMNTQSMPSQPQRGVEAYDVIANCIFQHRVDGQSAVMQTAAMTKAIIAALRLDKPAPQGHDTEKRCAFCQDLHGEERCSCNPPKHPSITFD